MEALIIDDSGHALIAAMEEKYFDLVWYARKSPLEDAEYWSGTPAEIKTAAGFDCLLTSRRSARTFSAGLPGAPFAPASRRSAVTWRLSQAINANT